MTMNHIGLFVGDIDKAIEFYSHTYQETYSAEYK